MVEETDMQRLKTLKTEGEKVRTEMRERTATYVGSGLGIVVGLAWNEAIKALIDYAFPFTDANSLVAKFVYAAVLTAIVVVVTMYVIRVPLPEKK